MQLKRMEDELLPSKKNLVIRKAGASNDIVVKKFSDQGRFQMEKQMGELLQNSELPIPPRLGIDEDQLTITYAYIVGDPIVDLIEDPDWGKIQAVFTRLCNWLVQFYNIILHKMGCQYILGDIHLRNFIYEHGTDQVFGLDLEECRPGRIESDLARLIVFTLNYEPSFTERKQTLATFIKETIFAELSLEEGFFRQEFGREAQELIQRRRNKPSHHHFGKTE